ncbi:MAG: hypothetical protein K6G20_09960 [Ruminococcus sp.]|nr:hypothetical protein [Ruminococcus sp.]
MLEKITKRVISGIAAAVMAISNVSPIMSIYADEDVQTTVCEETTSETNTSTDEFDLTHKSIELYPDEQNDEKTVMLEGLMPEGAEAQAVDVSEEHIGIAAYDITITAGESEYQPGEENPILVQISDPVIHDSDCLQLWHIRDDGEREQIEDFSVEEGKISFYATGFSVYEIVDDVNVRPFNESAFFDVLDERGEEGFYVSFLFGGKDKPGVAPGVADNGQFYLKNDSMTISNQGDRKGISLVRPKNTSDGAVKLYFQSVEGETGCYYLYIKDGSVRKYIKMYTGTNFGNNGANNSLRSALDYTTDENEKTKFVLDHASSTDNQYKIYATLSDNKKHYWVVDDKNNPKSIVGYQSAGDVNSAWITIHDFSTIPDDPYKLGGKTYGLMHYVSGATGNVLMATDDVHNSLKVNTSVVRPEGADSKLLYVAQNTDITEWTFEWAGDDTYYIYAQFGETKKYLNLGKVNESDDENTISAIETDEPQAIRVRPDSNGRILLSVGDKCVDFLANNANISESGRFITSAEGSYLYFVSHTEIADDEMVTYKAKEVSVSEVKNGEQVIVYTRIWDDKRKRYNFYAIDHDGSLVPCYERGNSIMWLSNKVNTMIWDFTEYYYEYTEDPNFYYELYNPYSGKYIAPRRSSGSVLSDEPIGINLEGRRYGEYFTTILAWDQHSYSYSGLKAELKNEKIEVSSRSKADTFYFAKVVDLNNDLTEVETVDNTEYGITMKMVNFTGGEIGGTNCTSSSDQHNVIGSTAYNSTSHTAGLLSTNLPDGKFPTATLTGKSLAELYDKTVSNADPDNFRTVNHLFIQSIYDQSGYFEYDSCQNFATLKNDHQSENEDGEKLYLMLENGEEVVQSYAEGETVPAGAEPIYDFFVSKELGTYDKVGNSTSNKTSLKHGQFFPYDDIDMDTYANTNGLNLYDALRHKLAETDPRKYERLHLIESVEFYFGMELDAGFTQTPNGKDNWGHDIIFEFTGDDDFWLYVDGELIIDLGGIHSALGAKVNFATGDIEVNGSKTNLRDVFASNYAARGMSQSEIITELKKYFDYDTSIADPQIDDFETVFKDYTNHSMKIFYMERGAGASNLHMRFNLNYVKEGNVTMTKEVTGSDDVDFDFVEYPVQIWYCSNVPGTDDPDYNSKALLDPNNEHVKVCYQNSTRSVVFKDSYTPPGTTKTYEKVFFINAEQKLEIHFPDDATHYQIVECGINSQVYDHVYINGTSVVPEDLGEYRASYSSGWARVKDRTNLMLSNHVDPDGIRSLVFQKRLYDADYLSNMDEDEKQLHKITAEQDPTTFSFRLYLSNGVTNDLTLTNMFNYRVRDPEQYYCQWNMDEEKLERFVPDPDAEYLIEAFELLNKLKNDHTLTTEEYTKLRGYLLSSHNTTTLNEALADIKNIRRNQTDDNGDALPSPFTSEQKTIIREALLYPITFETSINGQISNIPAWYTVEVPNLLAGTVFKVEERDSSSERPLGYDRVEYERDQDTYYTIEDGVENVGIVSAAESPYMNVINKRGYEIQAKKIWTDRDAASGHDDICVALYIKQSDGTYKIADNIDYPVRCLRSPDTEVRFFMDSLDGYSLSDLYIYEVTPKVVYTVDDNGYVSGYSDADNDFIRITDGNFADIHAIDRITNAEEEYKYAVTYAGGESVNPLNSIQMKKTWSDEEKANNASIYTALCVKQTDDTYKLVDSSLLPVRKLIAPNDTMRYFIPELDEGKVADDYKIFEIELTDPNITVDESGCVSGYSNPHVETIINNNLLSISDSTFEVYTARADSITNTRQGGIVIGLYKMGTRKMANNTIDVSANETAGVPLAGGVFKLEKVENIIDPKTNEKKRSLIGNYTSDADGKITIMYSFERNSETDGNFEDDTYYELTQISSPATYIGLPEPVKFAVGLGDDPDIIVSGNPPEWNNYHKLPGETEEVVAFIDVYNKPFTLKAIKVDSEDNTRLEGAHFALYKGVNSVDGLIPADQPINGYSDLVTDSNGEIPRIIQSLEKGTYFLKETSPKSGYKPYDRYIRFVVGENDIELVASVITQTTTENNVTVTTITSNTGIKLIKNDSDSYSCVLQIPNEKDESNYYFDIEKIIFVDKNIHVSDKEQKFLFKVDRFDENETAFSNKNIRGTFYVTLSCNKEMIYTTDDSIKLDGAKYNYSFFYDADTVSPANSKFRTADSSVEKRYTEAGKSANGSADYVYPAAIWNGRKTVRVMKEGIYRISEVNKWSVTDYDFWNGSNRYKGYGDGTHGETVITNGFRDSTTSGSMALPAADKNCVYINVKNVRAGEFDTASKTLDSKTVWRPTASFTNSETEFAYLSSQAYADNTISR